MIPAEAVVAAARKMFSKWDELPESSKEHLYPNVREILEAAAPHMYRDWLNTTQGEE